MGFPLLSESPLFLYNIGTEDDRRWSQIYRKYNANPLGKQVGDCTVRAISRALGLPWEEVYIGLIFEGFLMCDMPSANRVWGAYLKRRGWIREPIPDTCPDCYTVADFCRDHPRGVYILAIDGHVVCVENGHWCDTWDSGNEIPIYFWKRKENEVCTEITTE